MNFKLMVTDRHVEIMVGIGGKGSGCLQCTHFLRHY